MRKPDGCAQDPVAVTGPDALVRGRAGEERRVVAMTSISARPYSRSDDASTLPSSRYAVSCIP